MNPLTRTKVNFRIKVFTQIYPKQNKNFKQKIFGKEKASYFYCTFI